MTTTAGASKFFPKAQEGFTTTTSGLVASGASTVGLNSTGNYSNGDTVVLIIDPGVAAKEQSFSGVIDTSGVQVTGVVWLSGTNVPHVSGATVVDYVAAGHIDLISAGALVSHNADGTPKTGVTYPASILTTPTIADFTNATHTHANAAGGGQIANSGISGVGAEKLSNPYKFKVSMNGAASTGNGVFSSAVPFDTEQFDTGNNISAGVFTAPISGFYQFNWAIEVTLSAGADETLISALYINNTAYAYGGLISYRNLQGSSGSSLAQMTAGQTADIRAFASSTRSLSVGDVVRNHFSGFLVSNT